MPRWRGSAPASSRMSPWPVPPRPSAAPRPPPGRAVPPVAPPWSPVGPRPAIWRPAAGARSPSPAPTVFVPPVRRGFSPLDQELALLPGHLTPLLQEHLTHLGSWIPFEKAAALLLRLTGGTASEPTARRQTLSAGA